MDREQEAAGGALNSSQQSEAAPPVYKGAWEFISGTGKYQSIKSHGTWTFHPINDTVGWDVLEGEYSRRSPTAAITRFVAEDTPNFSSSHHRDDAFRVEGQPTLIEMTSLGEGGCDLA